MVVSKLDRAYGRQAFGDDPVSYHAARPQYPEWVFETLSSRCGLRRGASGFEIGAGTGTATQRLLSSGIAPLIAIEPDKRLADFLDKHCSAAALEVIVSPFEDAVLPEAAFDIGISATAFHWLDENAALAKITRLLRPGGWWAAMWNVFGDASRADPFHDATTALLAGPVSPSAGERGIPFALDHKARLEALMRHGFVEAETMTSQWSLRLTADQTVALYATYSNVNVRADRDDVLEEIGRIAREDFGDRVVRNMVTSLYIAQRPR
jgi:SAM-dependent methyltransferase